ncbi:MAG: DUF308 domain-containing protein [Methanomassiliicoccus sp.]|nr:DUF308 domain-containing protein [Methanomassiliicoccus sp.]
MATGKRMRSWWGRVVVGIIALVFGLAFLFVPGVTLTLFLYMFGLLLILSGIVLLGFSRDKATGKNWRTLNMVEGILIIILGIIVILAPGITAVFAIYLFAAFAIITGIMQIGEGLAAPKGFATFGTSNRTLLVVSGFFSLIVGILIAVFPGAGILALLWLIGIFLIIVGVLNIASGLRIHREVGRPEPSQQR